MRAGQEGVVVVEVGAGVVEEEDMGETGGMEGEMIEGAAETIAVMVVEGIEMEEGETEGIEAIPEIDVAPDPEVTQEDDGIEAHPDVKEVQIERTEVQIGRTEVRRERTEVQRERTEVQRERIEVQRERIEVQRERIEVARKPVVVTAEADPDHRQR